MSKSVVVFVVFEYLHGATLRKGNIGIQLTNRTKVSNTKDIDDLTATIWEKGFKEAVITDWKELDLQDTILPPPAPEK